METTKMLHNTNSFVPVRRFLNMASILCTLVVEHACLRQRSAIRLRRKLPEQIPKILGELPQVPESPFVGDIGRLGMRVAESAQIAECAVQPVQLQESRGRYVEVLLEGVVQGPFRGTGRSA